MGHSAPRAVARLGWRSRIGGRTGGLALWSGCHLHYHGDQSLLLVRLLIPLLRRGVSAGTVERFFYVRSALGGPHLRLRVRTPSDSAATDLRRSLTAEASRFFAAFPSSDPWPPERIRRSNQAILCNDPAESDDRVHPDQTVRFEPFRPEVERYGGPRALPWSLDLFVLSSLACLEGLQRAGRLAAAIRILGSQAVASAAGPAELAGLLSGMVARAPAAFAPAVDRADAAFEERGAAVAETLASGLAEGAGGPGTLAAGARRLRELLADAGEPVRGEVLLSQLHMTANRLGLTNPQEVYVLRLLERVAGRWRESGGGPPAAPADAEQGGDTGATGRDGLADLVTPALRSFTGVDGECG